ncbi:MAG: hypothetical protein LBQ83_00060 [Candidatus Margulisbacteria bacterium]|jgi:hypothetical protein|nr:hypothetical protein [Candidatus Margulisiibacteriota bacterium]
MLPEGSSQFEIVVKREKNSFKATCSIFPEVTGTGKDEAKAIENLADSLADKMGTVVKSALDEFLKKDLLCLLRAEARVAETWRARQQKAAGQTPPEQNPAGPQECPAQDSEKKFVFQMPPVNMLLSGANIPLDRLNPVLGGLIMVLGLHALHRDMPRRVGWLERECSETQAQEDQFFFAMLNSGAFDSLQPTERRTPFGLMMGIPMSFN